MVEKSIRSKGELLVHLHRVRERTLRLAHGLTLQDLERPTENPGWTVKDLLTHIAAAEGSILGSIQRSLRGEPARSPDFDINRWNARQIEKRRGHTVAQLLAELDESRAETKRILESLSEATLDQAVPFMDQLRTFWERFQRIGDHEAEHLTQLERALSLDPAGAQRKEGG